MIRKFIILILLLMLGGIVVILFINKQDGQLFLPFNKLKHPNLSIPKIPDVKHIHTKLTNIIKKKEKCKLNKKSTIYRWKDKNNVWHYSDKKNPNGPSEIFQVPFRNDDKTNQLLHVDTKKKSQSILKPPSGTSPQTILFPDVSKITDQAKCVKKELEGRYKDQKKMLDKLAD